MSEECACGYCPNCQRRQLITDRLAEGWAIELGMLVPPVGDSRRNMAAQWTLVLFQGHKVHVPTYANNTVGIKDDEVIAAGGTQFETGAVRSADKNHVMYQLISPIGMRRLAETMKEGFDKYGAYNWERGMPIGDILNHALDHIYAYLANPSKSARTEDDLAHAAWNLFAAMHMEETHPELDHGLRPKHDQQSKP